MLGAFVCLILFIAAALLYLKHIENETQQPIARNAADIEALNVRNAQIPDTDTQSGLFFDTVSIEETAEASNTLLRQDREVYAIDASVATIADTFNVNISHSVLAHVSEKLKAENATLKQQIAAFTKESTERHDWQGKEIAGMKKAGLQDDVNNGIASPADTVSSLAWKDTSGFTDAYDIPKGATGTWALYKKKYEVDTNEKTCSECGVEYGGAHQCEGQTCIICGVSFTSKHTCPSGYDYTPNCSYCTAGCSACAIGSGGSSDSYY